MAGKKNANEHEKRNEEWKKYISMDWPVVNGMLYCEGGTNLGILYYFADHAQHTIKCVQHKHLVVPFISDIEYIMHTMYKSF